MIMNQLNMRSFKPGQTLLEVLIAITVIVIGLMAVIGLAIGNATAAEESANRTTAANLAREALEVVKQQRDSNWLSNKNFSEIINPTYSKAYIKLDPADPSGVSWGIVFGNYSLDADDTLVSWVDDGQGGKYYNQQGGGQPTKFHRLITMQRLCQSSDNRGINFAYTVKPSGVNCDAGNNLIGVQVTADVKWAKPLGTGQVTAQTRLFDWR